MSATMGTNLNFSGVNTIKFANHINFNASAFAVKPMKTFVADDLDDCFAYNSLLE